ncbi:hypothetical protein GCM10022384_39320 [Streptomyces marokkonensis]|uniref:Uncharacterized protein n=1 Tax=Streptomyces marokkonensis TaxID=324855 RepID=A0ABP7QSW3_9ACTN
MTSEAVTAESAGTWNLGGPPVRSVGFDATLLTGGAAFHLGTASDGERAVAVLRRAVELGVDHIDGTGRGALTGRAHARYTVHTPSRMMCRFFNSRTSCHACTVSGRTRNQA